MIDLNSFDISASVRRNIPLRMISSTPIFEAIAKMSETNSGYVLVMESDPSAEKSRLVGILTKTDILRIVAKNLAVADLLLQDAMSHPVISIQETELKDVTLAVKPIPRISDSLFACTQWRSHSGGCINPR